MSHKTSSASHWLEADDSDSEEVYGSSDDDRETSRSAATSTRASKRRRIAEDENSYAISQKTHAKSTGFGVVKQIDGNGKQESEQQKHSSTRAEREDSVDEDDEDEIEEDDHDDEDDDDKAEDEEQEEEEDLDDYEGPPIADKNAVFTNPDKLKPLSKTQLEASKKATEKTGVIYLSRIPVCTIQLLPMVVTTT